MRTLFWVYSRISSHFLQDKILTLWHHRKAISQADLYSFKLCVSLPMIIPSNYFSAPSFSFVKSHYKSYTSYLDNPCFLLKALKYCLLYVHDICLYLYYSIYQPVWQWFVYLSLLHCEYHQKKNCFLSKWARIPAHCLAQSRNPINYSVKSKDSCSLVSQEQKSDNSLIFISLCKFLKRWQS